MKITRFIVAAAVSATLAAAFSACDSRSQKSSAEGDEKVVVAYVTSWTQIMPDPNFVTHINYAFGHVNETFNGVKIDNEARLKQISDLKKEYPDLKVMLSIGGWGSGRFSEMVADPELRGAFAKDCKRVVKEYGLDGIDIDWEYPTNGSAGISYSPDDTENYTLMMRDIHEQIGKDKLLTLASSATGQYIDFPAIMPYVDFVNIMTYDMAGAPKHHSALYRSEMTGGLSCEEAVENHVKAGVPISKLVLGIPFYGHGCKEISNFIDYNKLIQLENYTMAWDSVAMAPYLINPEGEVVCNYDDPRSIALKCTYVHENGMKGGMYWEYAGDDEQGTLRQAVYNGIMQK